MTAALPVRCGKPIFVSPLLFAQFSRFLTCPTPLCGVGHRLVNWSAPSRGYAGQRRIRSSLTKANRHAEQIAAFARIPQPQGLTEQRLSGTLFAPSLFWKIPRTYKKPARGAYPRLVPFAKGGRFFCADAFRTASLRKGGAAARILRAAAPFVFISAGFMRDISLQIRPESRKKR